MSSLIGGRSGNRGTCAGSCRLKYDIVDKHGKKLNKNNYPLSTKDLNSLECLKDLIEIGVKSLKIEGRMKSKEYVYAVVSLYREAIDSYYQNKIVKINEDKLLKLKKIFNRNYTKGFLNNANNEEIINDFRPNHMGVPVGTIISCEKNIAKIKLTDSISLGSGLRVLGNKEDIGIIVNDFYINKKLVKKADAGDIITIKVNSNVLPGSIVLITSDKAIADEINEAINRNERKGEAG